MDTRKRKLEYWRERGRRQTMERAAQKPEDPISLLSETTCAYLAGLLDGEGSFTLARAVTGHIIPTIDIIMTHEPTIAWAAQQIGGARFTRRLRNPLHRTQAHVRMTGKRAILLAGRVLPYMITKREQALIFIEFAATYGRWGGIALTVAARAERERLKERIHRLNRFHKDNNSSNNPDATDDGAEIGGDRTIETCP